MQPSFFLYVLLALPTLVNAQSNLATQLANQVCRCMETTDRAAPPPERARNCVRLVAFRRKNEILEELSLDPENPSELNLLSERLADLLSRNCPVLTTLRLDDVERELRWSDGNSRREANAEGRRYKFFKKTVADPPEETVSESPSIWRIAGKVTGRPGRGILRLRLPDGTVQLLEFPAAVSRRVELVEGQMVTAVCDRQWRKSETGGIVALVVRAIE